MNGKVVVTFDGMTKEEAEDLLEENGFGQEDYDWYWDKENHLIFDLDYISDFPMDCEGVNWDIVDEEN